MAETHVKTISACTAIATTGDCPSHTEPTECMFYGGRTITTTLGHELCTAHKLQATLNQSKCIQHIGTDYTWCFFSTGTRTQDV